MTIDRHFSYKNHLYVYKYIQASVGRSNTMDGVESPVSFSYTYMYKKAYIHNEHAPVYMLV